MSGLMATVLSNDQIEQIKKTTEEIIEEVGFRIQHKEIRHRCRVAGAQVDESREIVCFPTPLLHELLAEVPSEYVIAELDGTEHVIGGDNQHCAAIVTDPWIIDYQTQQPRRPRLDDVRRHTIIAQKLDRIVACSRMDFPVSDVPGPTSSLRALEEHLLNYAKHIYVMPTSAESFEQYLDIGDILTQDRNLAQSRLMSVAVAVISPLTLAGFNGDILMRACAHNFPVTGTICSAAGATSPYSIAANLLQSNIENIFMAALTQIVSPGHPFKYSFGPSVTNMQSGDNMYYTLDKVLWKIASVQMGRFYNMPVGAECGGTMTYRYDQQNGAEGILFMLAAQIPKAHLLAGFGSCYNAMGMSAEMMLIQMAWLEAAEFLGRGINTDSLHLGVESIRKVGPGGNFLTDDLTIELLRSGEFFSNELFDFSGVTGEEPSLLERAHAKVEELVADFQSPVPQNVQADLRDYFDDEYEGLRR